jgi:uncharacterized protein (DUF736 family)
MTCIGTFTATSNGFEGRLQTLTLGLMLAIVDAEPNDAENAPDYRITMGEGDDSYGVGAGWKRVGEKAGAYVALLIDDPAFTQPLRANLFHSDSGNHVLMWSRGPRRETAS